MLSPASKVPAKFGDVPDITRLARMAHLVWTRVILPILLFLFPHLFRRLFFHLSSHLLRSLGFGRSFYLLLNTFDLIASYLLFLVRL